MEEKLVSVIIPMYNVEKYLTKCIESVINQTYKNLEIVFIDDGSPDNCGKIADEYAKKDNRIKVIHKENGGLVSAWTTGVLNSVGEYISFIDSDDWVELDYIEKLYKALKENDADMSICGFKEVYEGSNKIVKKSSFYVNTNKEGIYEGEKLEEFKKEAVEKLHSSVNLYRWNKLFKREIVMNNFNYNQLKVTMFEDTFISISSIIDSKKIAVIGDNLYDYYQRKSSMIHKFNEKILETSLIYDETIEKLLKDKGYYTDKVITMDRVRNMVFLTEKLLESNNKNKKEIFKNFKDYEIFVKINEHSEYFKDLSKFRRWIIKSINKRSYSLAVLLIHLRRVIYVFKLILKKRNKE